MKLPPHRIDYTKLAQDIYDSAMYKGYKFIKGRNLDSWLQYGWSMLFRRKMTDHDLEVLPRFLKKRLWLDIKIKGNEKLSPKERMFNNQYIGADGYIYMNKMMCSGEPINPKETARLNKLMEQYKQDRLARYEEYEMRMLKEMAEKKRFNDQGFTYKGIKLVRR
ncbi:MAG: hypothetical protein O3C07_03270 [Bacteroidetes bacterium]|nr:hypothetical protein [Bacteroidota bacterium]